MEIVSNRMQSIPIGGKKNHHRVYLKLTPEQFKTAFLESAAKVMQDRNESSTEYVIDDSNRELINQMYFYLVGDKRYEKDLSKGIYFYGAHGFGKTIILMALIGIVEKYSIRRFVRVSAREFCDLVKTNSVYKFKKKTMFVDDIFKEVMEAEWNKHAFIKLVESQYNYGAWVFWASNYKVETLIAGGSGRGGYGQVTFDRMKSMVNFYELKGKSRRQ